MKISFQRPDWVRRINYLGESVGGAGNLVSLDPEELCQIAVKATGLEDFGEDTWREAFQRLISALEEQAQLNTLGRLMCRQELIRSLSCRLQLLEAHRRNPTVGQRAIKAPVFIVGQSRSGTTILHELMALDPALRAPLAWETLHPPQFPPVSSVPGPLLAECEQEFWSDVVPEFSAVHELGAMLPMECLTLLMPEFASAMPSATVAVSDFLMWRAFEDAGPAYRSHRQFLQLLSDSQDGRTWLLKSPVHMMTMGALFETYPDARIIHTHRDPVKTIPSSISTIATARAIRSDAVDVSDVIETITIGFQMALEGIIDMREQGQIPDRQIADVHFSDFLANPVDALGAAYEQLGLNFTAEFAQKATRYLEEKPQGKHGEHKYSLDEFGLDASEISSAFDRYRQHYGIAEGV